MDNLPPSVTQSLILFLLMAAGFGAGKAGVLRGETIKVLSKFLVEFTLPALIIMSMQRPFSMELRDQALRILGFSAVFYALTIPLSYLLCAGYRKASPAEKGVHRFAMSFSNVGFMGFPVAESLLGRDSLFIVSIYNIPFQILAFSLGVVMVGGAVAKKAGSRRQQLVQSLMLLRNPAILGAVAGFALFMLSVRIPEPVATAMNLFGGMTTPLAMTVIGAVLAQTRIGPVLGNPRLWLTTAYRLLANPLMVAGAAAALGLSGLDMQVPVLIAAMPIAANTSILAGAYDGDEVMASSLVFVSTVLSLLTIPLMGLLIL